MKKKLALAACVMLCAGLIIAGTAAAVMKFDFSRLNTTTVSSPALSDAPERGGDFAGGSEKTGTDFTIVTHTVEDSFTALSVTSDSCSVELLPSEDGTARVTYPVADGIEHSAAVKNGTLEVSWQDKRSWNNQIGIYFGTEDIFRIRVYLPESQLGAVTVQTQSGDIDIGEGLSLGRVSLTASSGDIGFRAACTGFSAVSSGGDISVSGISCPDASIESTSGEIELESSEASSRLRLKSTSGDIKLRSIACGDADIGSTSGEVELKEVKASGSIRIETTSGSIDLERCDGARLELTSSSGDIEGSLLSGKIFSAASSSGDIGLPVSDPTGGECRIKTASGDISVVIES